MISVVVATYNGEKYIEAQLRSILSQTLSADEVLIFDDGSTDKTVDKINSFINSNDCHGWQLVLNKENKGYCRNFLEGALSAKGDIIFLCDQDDVWHPEKLEAMVMSMQENQDIKALCCACDLIDKNGDSKLQAGNIGVLFSQNDGSIRTFEPEQFVGRSFIRGCSVGFKRELLALLAPLELNGLLSHDWLITFTAALTGKCAVLNRVLMSYRCHGENTSFGERKYGENALKKRVEGLIGSVDGHCYILDNADCYPNMTESLKKRLQKHVVFENKRIEYLTNGGILSFLRCAFAIRRYKCYYDSIGGAVRVLLGDFSYRKNRKFTSI